MNGAQVHEAWKRHHVEQQRASSSRMRAAAAWVLSSFPSLCDDGHPDPTLLLATLRLKGEAPGRPVTKAQVVDWARKYHTGLHQRGDHDDAYLAEELARLETTT